MNGSNKGLVELHDKFLLDLLNWVKAEYPAVLRAKEILKENASAPLNKTSKSARPRQKQEYIYSFRQAQDSITETTIGKNTHNAHFTKDEFLELIEVFVGLVDSRGYFQADEKHYKKSGYSPNRLRAALRICLQLGIMKKTFMKGRLCSVSGGSAGFLSAAERAWKERAHTL